MGTIAFIFYNFSPSEHSFFLPCPLKYTTGFYCPGCGSQRAIHQLLHGELMTAFRLNPFMILTLPLLIYGLGVTVYNAVFNTRYRIALFYNNFFIYSYFGIAILYWVARNLPFYPFTYLAPSE